MGCSSSVAIETNVVIIGGGYGGHALAQALDGSKANVTIIEKRDTFNHNLANLRAVVDPKYAAAVNISYKHAYKTAKLVHGTATAVRSDRVVVSTAKNPATEIPFDYLVIATGSSMRGPAKLPDTAAESATYLAQKRTEIAASKRITIVGGGSVGLELAGEIRAAHPDSAITVVNGGSEVLSSMEGKKPAFLTKVMEKLEAQNIRVLNGQRVTAPAPPTGAAAAAAATDSKTEEESKTAAAATPPAFIDGVVRGTQTVQTSGGEAIETDLLIWATGGRPNSGPFSTGFLAPHLGPDGRIKVGPELLVEDCPNIFALGDVASVGEASLAFYAGEQAAHVAKAIAAATAGRKLPVYKRQGPAMVLTLGPADGALQVGPMGVKGGKFVTAFKGDLMTKKTVKGFHQPAPSL